MHRHMSPRSLGIRVITEYSATSGFGNLIRSMELANEFSHTGPTELLVLTQFESRCKSIIPNSANYEVKFYETSTDLIQSITTLDYAILDCPSFASEEIAAGIKSSLPLSKVIALDYFSDSRNFDLRISLFDQTLKTFETTSARHQVGIEFAVISKNVASIPRRERIPEILVKLSGQESKLLEKIEEIIRDEAKALSFKVCVIDNSSDGVNNPDFRAQTDFLTQLASCALYVGSGVSTLLESSLLETATIFVGSNEAERKFGEAISSIHSVCALDSTSLQFSDELRLCVKKAIQTKDFEGLIPRIDLDYLGAQRIVKLVLKS